MRSYGLFLLLSVLFFSACQPKNETDENTETLVEETVSPSASLSPQYFLPKLGIEKGNKDQGIQMYIQAASKEIKHGQVTNGEGIFDVYKIYEKDGTELAHIYCIQNDAMMEIPHYIEIVSPTIPTPEGLKVGDNFAKVQELYGDVPLVGSEIEGWTHAYVGSVELRLSSYNPTVKGATAEPDDEVLSIAFFL